MTLSIDRIRKAREAGYDDDKIIDSIEKRDPELGARIKKAKESGYDSAKIMQSIEKRLAMQTNQATPETQAIQPNQPTQVTPATPANESTPASSLVNSVQPNQSQSIGQSFKSGLQSSASGELAKSVFGGKSEEEVAQDPGFWAQLVHTGGELTGDTPYFLAGATLGGALGSAFGPLGAVVGGSAGAMAMPAFIKESLKEYRKYVEKGNDLTFGEFFNSADKVASKTLNQGLFGAILGSVNKAMPLLKNIPGIGNLFNSKIAQKGATVAAEAATVATVPAVSEGRLPTTNDFAHALALVAGLNILHIPGAIRDKINKQGKASGLTPEEFVKSPEARNLVQDVNQVFSKAELQKNAPEVIGKESGKIQERLPERSENSRSELEDLKQNLIQKVDQLPQGNKKKLAKAAIDKGQVRTPEQLDNFLQEYEDIFPTIQGKTMRDRNRKFINKLSEKNKETREFEDKTGEESNVPNLSNQQKLKQAQIKLRGARERGDEKEIKEALKQRNILKERVQREQRQKNKAVNLQPEVEPKEIEQPTKSEEQPENVEQKTPQEMEKSIPTADKAIEEITGKSAADQISYLESRSEQIIESAIEKIKDPKNSIKEAGAAINKAVFNVLAPLEKIEEHLPVDQRVSTRIKLAQSVASEINSTLENGIFSNLTGKIESDSLKQAYGDLAWKSITKGLKPQEYSLRELNDYRTSKISLKRQREGKTTGIGTKEAREDVSRLIQKYEPIDKKIREFQKAVLSHYGKDLLGKELTDLWNKDYYSSLYRVMESGNDAILHSGSLAPRRSFFRYKGSERKILPAAESDIYNTATLIQNARKNDAILQYKKLVEQGELPGEIKKSERQKIPNEISKELDLPEGTEELAENLYAQSRKDSFAPKSRENIIRGWENGKAFEIQLPKDIYDIFSTFTPTDYPTIVKVLAGSVRTFSRGISMEPRKFASIYARDALSSLIHSRTGHNPWSIVQALGDIYKGKDVYKQFLSLGGDLYAARLAQRIDRVKKIEDLITPGKEGIVVPFDKMGSFFSKYPKLLNGISLSVPLAEYKRALKVFGDTEQGRILAMMEARRVVYDPTIRGGSFISKELAQVFPFWNISLQDPAMIARNSKNKGMFVKGILALSLPAIAFKMYNEDNPNYQDLTPEDKAAYYHLFAGDYHVRFSSPWLLGTMFKVGAELFWDIAHGRGGEGWEALYSDFARNITGSMNPLIQAAVEVTTEKSLPSPLGYVLGTETNAPDVVPKRLKGLPANEQFTSKTSQVARWWGNLWGFSPVKVEKIAKTLGGQSASTGLALIDEIAYWSGLAEDKRPEQKEKNYLLLGSFVADSTPTRTKYATQFYKMLDEERRAKTPLGKTLTHYNTKISKSFRKYREIEDSKIDPKQKKQILQKLQVEINDLYKEAVKNSTKQ